MGKKLYVGNLGYSVTSTDLQTMFAAHGAVSFFRHRRDAEEMQHGAKPAKPETDNR